MAKPIINKNAQVRRIAARQRLERLHEECQRRQLRRKKAGGFLIAGASVAALMGIAFLKARADTGTTTENLTESLTE